MRHPALFELRLRLFLGSGRAYWLRAPPGMPRENTSRRRAMIQNAPYRELAHCNVDQVRFQ